MAISTKQLTRLLQPVFGTTPMDLETLEGLAQDSSRYGLITVERVVQGLDHCPTPMEFLAALEEQARMAAVERIAAGYDEAHPHPLGECACEGTGFTTIREAGPDGPEVVRPCDVCLPETFGRWAGGHFGEHRNCAECREVKGYRKRRKLSRV